jgi:hypothetical protein
MGEWGDNFIITKTTLYEERDEAKRQEHLVEIAKYKPEQIVYIDESGINKHLHREYGRAPRGEQVLGDVKGKKFQRLSMIAGLCDNKIIAPFTHEITTDAKLFNGWLEQCLLPELQPAGVC